MGAINDYRNIKNGKIFIEIFQNYILLFCGIEKLNNFNK
jgi:hypothetical protein